MVEIFLEEAKQAALYMHYDYIGTEHMLFALFFNRPEIKGILSMNGFDLKKITKILLDAVPEKNEAKVKDLQITTVLRGVKKYALENATAHRRESPNALDVLNALCIDDIGKAYEILKKIGYKPMKDPSIEQVLTHDDFKILGEREKRAYKGTLDSEYVVLFETEKASPTIVYQSNFPRLMGDALRAKELFERFSIFYKEEPDIKTVMQQITKSIQENTTLLDKVLASENNYLLE